MAHKSRVTGDWFTYEGALHLAGKIAVYWEKQGYKAPTVFAVATGLRDKDGAEMYCVRSNMLNGRPR